MLANTLSVASLIFHLRIAGRVMRFALLIGAGLSAVAALGCFTPLRDVVLVTLLGERPGGAVMELLLPALMIGVAMPFLQAARFALRGVLIARGATAAITLSTGVTLLLLASALAFERPPSARNGA
ncbi:MAG: hypothetical protein ACT4PV_08335 [Planctomycetaceae bacterium]